jgi:hypothetical protein
VTTRFRPTPVPSSLHPVVKRLFVEMNEQQCTDKLMAKRSGVNNWTISAWRHRTIPNVRNIEACLNVLGLELYVRQRRYEGDH